MELAQTRSRVDAGGAFGRGFATDIWYFAATTAELRPGRLTRRELLGEPVLLGRSRSGGLFALRDICPHRAAPLSAGAFDRDADGAEVVVCPYHGWRFGLDGVCTAIPSLTKDQAFEVERVRLRRFPIAESQGLVFVWMPSQPDHEAAPDRPTPVFPGVVGGRPKIVETMDFEAHVDHAAVGLMDPAHGPFVHQQWWWRSRKSAHAKAKRFEPAEAGFTMVRHTPSANSRAYALLGGSPRTEITFALPGFRWEHVIVGERQLLALTCLTPLDEARTRVTQLVWSDHPIFALARPLIAAATRRFLRQDRDMVDLQGQGLKYRPSLMWVDDADRQAKWYLALKKEWAASRREGRPFVNPVTPATLQWVS